MSIVALGTVNVQTPAEDLSAEEWLEDLLSLIYRTVKEVIQRLIEAALQREIKALLGREPYQRASEKDDQEVYGTFCLKCGTRLRRKFRRNGHYRRGLVVGGGLCWGVWVPRLECQCGGDVHVRFRTFQPRQRIWDDFRAWVSSLLGENLSLRQVQRLLGMVGEVVPGLRYLNEIVLAEGQERKQGRWQAVEEVPPVMVLDGIYATVMEATGQYKTDILGRKRKVKRARRRPIYVAQGLWPDSGRTEVLDWEVGRTKRESKEGWEALVRRLRFRGVRAETGLQLVLSDGSPGLPKVLEKYWPQVAHQRCVVHKLRNVWRDLVEPEDLDPETVRQYKQTILQEVAHIWQASTKEKAYRNKEEVVKRWSESQPKAMATLARDFSLTVTFYDFVAQGWPARRLYTTNALERENRTWRRMIRQAVIFHSRAGLEARVQRLTVKNSLGGILPAIV
jgi:transposase-like protein